MNREVVKDFLNLPGIAGVALMDRRSRPYFCGVDSALNFQQKEALAQGIRQVVETTPESFESFEFQFAAHQVYIYKLASDMILLVLTSSGLVYSDYLPALQKLKAALSADLSTGVATFRLLAGNITLSGQEYWKPAASDGTKPGQTAAVPAPVAKTASGTSTGSRNGFHDAASPQPDAKNGTHQVTLKEILAALNQLSEFTTQYLGVAVISNYWKTSRPQNIEWLNHFQVNRKAEISFNGESSQSESGEVTEQEISSIQSWVAAFINRCAKVIRDFPALVEQKALNPQQKELLLP
ncbi:MAG: hypothetical protein AB4352_16360 [Hormoscilla sp.]